MDLLASESLVLGVVLWIDLKEPALRNSIRLPDPFIDKGE